MKAIQSIGVLTSGGDSPGMNAAIRAVTRSAIFAGWKVYGIYRGYEGLINGEIKEFTSESVSNVIQRGGTILKTARSKEFMTEEGRAKAYENLRRHHIDALVVIGGNGSLSGAQELAREHDIRIIGLPGTIDNDLYGTDSTIGYDTALNTIVDCVDKIRDTATSHDRIFFVEVMGRDAGFLAQNSAIAAGAEAAIIPEDRTDIDQLAQFIGRGIRKSKNSSIVLVSESKKDGGAMHYAERVRKEYPQYDVRVTIPDPGIPPGRSGRRSPQGRTAQHHDRHQERPGGLCAHQQGCQDRQAHRSGADQRPYRSIDLIYTSCCGNGISIPFSFRIL